MAHIHSVYDTDTHFQINKTTREIKNVSSSKTTITQFDHNSERFTFEIPRFIDGHDMSLCNKVEVHYINIDSTDKTKQNVGVYTVDDLQISPEAEDIVICSWLISQGATQLAGPLTFLLRYACITDGVLDYAWNTARHTSISVSNGIYNGEAIIEEYSDVLAEWESKINHLEELVTRIDVPVLQNPKLWELESGWYYIDTGFYYSELPSLEDRYQELASEGLFYVYQNIDCNYYAWDKAGCQFYGSISQTDEGYNGYCKKRNLSTEMDVENPSDEKYLSEKAVYNAIQEVARQTSEQCEMIANKNQYIGESSSHDTYPTSKAVYEAIQNALYVDEGVTV